MTIRVVKEQWAIVDCSGYYKGFSGKYLRSVYQLLSSFNKFTIVLKFSRENRIDYFSSCCILVS